MRSKEYFKDLEDVQVDLTLDDDTELLCDVVCIFPMNDKRYIVLSPASEKHKDELFIYRFSEDENDEPVLSNIEDWDEYEAAEDRFDEILDEEEYDEWVGEDEE